jgi:integrase
MIKALQLNGLSERTQESYVRTVRMLTEHCKKTPESITEDELREYFLYRKNVSSWSPKTMRICYCGIRFFTRTPTARLAHLQYPPRPGGAPAASILSEEEVRRILSCVNTPTTTPT